MPNKLNKIKPQKDIELFQISTLLHELGLTWEDCNNDTECPDIILTLHEGYKVGIEVTQYGDGKLDEASSAFYDVLHEYARIIDRKSTVRYFASVTPMGQSLAKDVMYKKNKAKIFEELDMFRLGIKPDYSNLKYIEAVDFYDAKHLQNSFFGISGAYWYGEINETLLLNTIKKKNDKLDNYREKPINKDLKEFWLSIYVNTQEAVDISTHIPIANIVSNYDRIYLCDSFYCKRIK